MPQIFLLLQILGCFSIINVPWTAAKLRSIPRALKKLIVLIFVICFPAITDEHILGDPYSAFFAVVTAHICFYIFLYMLKTLDL